MSDADYTDSGKPLFKKYKITFPCLYIHKICVCI